MSGRRRTVEFDDADIREAIRKAALADLNANATDVVDVALDTHGDLYSAVVTFDPAKQIRPPEPTQTTTTLACKSPKAINGLCVREPTSSGSSVFLCKNCGRP